MFDLRDYQQDFVARIRDSFRTHRRVLGVSPTGSGKTRCFAYITANAAAKGSQTILMAHRTEIVSQISAALDDLGVRHGRIQPGHAMTEDVIQCGMIQTISRRLDKIRPPKFLVVDEAHHCASESYDSVCRFWPDVKILGVTATPRRMDGRGLGRLFEDMVLGPTPAELIGDRWLASYRYLAPPSKVDLSGVKKRAGDYAVDQLAAAVDTTVITGDAVAHYAEYLAPRAAIVFTVTVDHAEHVAQQFSASGFRAASVDGTMDRDTRRDRIEGIGNGRYQILTSCALISEGLDVPSVGGIVLLRPTASLALHLQQIGRGLRPKDDGSSCVILDHVGNIKEHGLPDAPRHWTLEDKQKKEPSPPSQCEVCYQIFASYPGWKAEYLKAIQSGEKEDCTAPDDPECLLRCSKGGIRELPAVVGGKLQEFSTTPLWAKGCDILRAKGDEFKALVNHADTREKLEEIRKARGYHHLWTKRVLEGRRRETPPP